MKNLISDDEFKQATVTLTMYYTPDLKDNVEATGVSIADFIKSLVVGANTIYQANSIPLMLSVHCMLKWDKSEKDQLLARQAYAEFKGHRGTIDNLLNTGDIAVLLTAKNLLLRFSRGNTRPLCEYRDGIDAVQNSNIDPVAFVATRWLACLKRE